MAPELRMNWPRNHQDDACQPTEGLSEERSELPAFPQAPAQSVCESAHRLSGEGWAFAQTSTPPPAPAPEIKQTFHQPGLFIGF